MYLCMYEDVDCIGVSIQQETRAPRYDIVQFSRFRAEVVEEDGETHGEDDHEKD